MLTRSVYQDSISVSLPYPTILKEKNEKKKKNTITRINLLQIKILKTKA